MIQRYEKDGWPTDSDDSWVLTKDHLAALEKQDDRITKLVASYISDLAEKDKRIRGLEEEYAWVETICKFLEERIKELEKDDQRYVRWAAAIRKYELWKDENEVLKKRIKELEEVIKAQAMLLASYRLGSIPPEWALDTLEKWNKTKEVADA